MGQLYGDRWKLTFGDKQTVVHTDVKIHAMSYT